MALWNPKANDLFLRAAEIEAPADRRLFLDQQCAGDADLRGQAAHCPLDPALSFFQHQGAQGVDPRRVVVQATARVQRFAARMPE